MEPGFHSVNSSELSSRFRPSDLLSSPSGAIDLGNILNGASVFLIASGPSFRGVDASLLRRPGILTMGLNNSPKTFRPNYWICVDEPQRFLLSIWLDPSIVKFVPLDHRDARLFDSSSQTLSRLTVAECPNVVFFESDLRYSPETFLESPSVSWGAEGSDGGRSVLLAAIRILYHLGAGNIFLLGVDFQMTQETPYHFPESRSSIAVKGNQQSYRILKKRLSALRPQLEEAGCFLWNCNPDSKLEVFPFVSIEEALACALSDFPASLASERTEGLYSESPTGNHSAEVFTAPTSKKLQDRRVDRTKTPMVREAHAILADSAPHGIEWGVLLLVDAALEWLLPWWRYHYEKSPNSAPVAIVDGGMSDQARQWIASAGWTLLTRPHNAPSSCSGWFLKPFALTDSPFETTVFCDLDIEIRDSLNAISRWCLDGVVLGRDLHPIGRHRRLFHDRCYFNSGLIGFGQERSAINSWCEETALLHQTFRSDQEILNLVLHEKEVALVALPSHYHQLRLDGDHAAATVMHWTGEEGKVHIRGEMKRLGIDLAV